MKYGNLTLGQIEALINILGGEAALPPILSGRAKVTVKIIRHLTALTSFMAEAGEVNLKDFFVEREGLLVSDSFQIQILAGVSEGVVSVAEKTVAYADLAQQASNVQITEELPKGCVFQNVDTFLVHLANLIMGQWGGMKGLLRTNINLNVFYVKVGGNFFTVLVSWLPGIRGWSCHSLPFKGFHCSWSAGTRVFSANFPQT